MTIRAVRGVRDILPGEAAKWQRVEDTARRTFEAYGYAEIRLPLFERTELFARGIGEVTDIVQKEMYTFPGAGNGLRQTLNGHEAGNGGYSQGEPTELCASPRPYSRRHVPEEGHVRWS